jgi:hypothetical protein
MRPARLQFLPIGFQQKKKIAGYPETSRISTEKEERYEVYLGNLRIGQHYWPA